MINITGVDLVQFTKDVYELSRPQGMGFLHYREGGLSDEQAQAEIDRCEGNDRIALSLDYVNGRACKMTVFRNADELTIQDKWFDHSEGDLEELLKRHSIQRQSAA